MVRLVFKGLAGVVGGQWKPMTCDNCDFYTPGMLATCDCQNYPMAGMPPLVIIAFIPHGACLLPELI